MESTVRSTTATAGQVLIAAGPFLYGEELRERYLSPYMIDRFPVTVARYSAFVTATGHRFPPGWRDECGPPDMQGHPVTGVTFYDAGAFAAWHGRALPTEEQWEKAARGTDGWAYPWGARFNLRNLNSRASRKRRTTPVDFYRGGRSPFGVYDMVGNVWEWTDSWFDGVEDLKVLKGGCYALTKEYAAVSVRHYNDPSFGNNLTGFRTVAPL